MIKWCEKHKIEMKNKNCFHDIKICVVTVTYGNRFNYLKKVIDACLSHPCVKKVIVVDNNSLKESREKLKQLDKKEQRIKVVFLKENKGSAGGFKIGLKEACQCKDCDFIYLLDDDNLPSETTFSMLITFWESLNLQNKEEKVGICSHREDKPVYKNAALTGKHYLIYGKKNSFMGFHFLNFLTKFEKNNVNTDKDYGVIPVAPYGGLFFHKKMINTIGYPDEKFFLYGDDFDFTSRIPNLFIVFHSVLKDLEKSFHVNKSYFSTRFFNAYDDNRLYYMVRNNIFFQKKQGLIDNYVIYFFNVILYVFGNLFLIPFNYKKGVLTRFKSLFMGIRDGFREV